MNFYHPDYIKVKENENEDNESDNGSSMSIYIVILIVFIILIIIIVAGLIIGKILFQKINKKKRANELDDTYEYISEEKNEGIN